MIRSAKLSEINDIVAIAKACAAKMVENGIFQWNEHYPSPSVFQGDAERKELYVLEVDKKIMGTIVLSTLMDAEYAPINWLTPNHNNLYIHRLAVHPTHQGKGHAQKLMAFAEDHARKNAFASIRLDTFSQNQRNQLFYSKRGYQKLGDIHFPKQSEHPFHCYELVL
jgi:ribosomal protein S18 acetylase RimI-like enzyme